MNFRRWRYLRRAFDSCGGGHVWYTYATQNKKLILRCENCGRTKTTEGQ